MVSGRFYGANIDTNKGLWALARAGPIFLRLLLLASQVTRFLRLGAGNGGENRGDGIDWYFVG